MQHLVVYVFLIFTASLEAQSSGPGFLFTRSNDTLEGFFRFKGVLELQNKGFTFVQNEQETFYPPSSIKEAFILQSETDTLRIIAVPKTLVRKFVDVENIDSTQDTHLLIETDLGAGPLQWHSVCSGIEVIHYGATFVNGQFNPGFTSRKPVFKEFISKNYKWARLPDTRYDCPALSDKLKKDKINPMNKMTKILSLYNHCKTR